MKRLIGLMAAMGLLVTLALPVAAGEPAGGGGGGGGDKVTLCHATNSLTNPFVAIQVDGSGNFSGHKADGGDFHINAKTGRQDFLLAGSGFETCDDAGDVAVTPLAPAVSDATCVAPGTLTLTAVEGVIYTITPAYTPGVSSGAFTVTAAADTDEGFVLAAGATTTFNVTVPAQLDCPAGAAAVAPSATAGTCLAPGALILTPVTGVMYSVSPAYAPGASGSFRVTASPAAGFTLTGQTVFDVTVPAQLVCNSGTLSGTSPTPPPVRSGTLASTGGPSGVPNTATEMPSSHLTVTIGGLLLIASLSIGTMQLALRRNRR